MNEPSSPRHRDATGNIAFDPHAGNFVAHYDTLRGRVRLALLHEQVVEHLARASTVLDIGGGAGQLALLLAGDGHDVTVLDPSSRMVDAARVAMAATEAGSSITVVEGSASDAGGLDRHGSFDAVLCHAVAPYVEDLDRLVRDVVTAARPGGVVSVVVKNRDALAMRPALEGRWEDALAAFDASGDAGGLGVENRAHTRDEVATALAAAGAEVSAWYGVRVLSDAMLPDDDTGLDEILPVEREAGRRDPYRSVARLLHVVARRSAGVDVHRS